MSADSTTTDALCESLKKIILEAEITRQQMGCPAASNHVEEMFRLIETMKSMVQQQQKQDNDSKGHVNEPFMWQIDDPMKSLKTQRREEREDFDTSDVNCTEQKEDVKYSRLKRNPRVHKSDVLHGMDEAVSGPAGPCPSVDGIQGAGKAAHRRHHRRHQERHQER
ncbi:hypothetical protein ACMFMF_002772 [Clarireedia jacksonii]